MEHPFVVSRCQTSQITRIRSFGLKSLEHDVDWETRSITSWSSRLRKSDAAPSWLRTEASSIPFFTWEGFYLGVFFTLCEVQAEGRSLIRGTVSAHPRSRLCRRRVIIRASEAVYATPEIVVMHCSRLVK